MWNRWHSENLSSHIFVQISLQNFPSVLPIVNANPDNLYNQIKLLLDNPMLRLNVGILGREYAMRVPGHHAVADQLPVLFIHNYSKLFSKS